MLNSTFFTFLAVTLADDSIVTAKTRFGTAIGSWGRRYLDNGNNLLRTEFDAPTSFSNATLSIAGIGYYEAFLNGAPAGGDDSRKLDTAWTDYAKRVYFQTFDVAETIERGAKKFVGCFARKWMVQLRQQRCSTTQPGCIDAPPQLIALLSIDGKPAAWTPKMDGAQLGADFARQPLQRRVV